MGCVLARRRLTTKKSKLVGTGVARHGMRARPPAFNHVKVELVGTGVARHGMRVRPPAFNHEKVETSGVHGQQGRSGACLSLRRKPTRLWCALAAR